MQTPLVVYSFCYNNLGEEGLINLASVRKEISKYLDKVREAKGVFVPVFSNTLFSDLEDQTFWKSIFEFIWMSDDD